MQTLTYEVHSVFSQSSVFIKKMLKYLELSQSINHPKRQQNLYPQLKIATYINVCFKSTVFL